jgi:excinuclease UvrABC nuclease subunit
VQWRQEKKQRRATIGKVGVWSLDQAREEARKMLFGFCSNVGHTERILEKPCFKHHLYRHYDKSGVLLYVGISLSAFNRLRQHKRNAHWFNDISFVKVEGFETKIAAESAERFAIKTENPLYNIHHKDIRAETKETDVIPWQEYFRSILPRKRRSYIPTPGQLSLLEM